MNHDLKYLQRRRNEIEQEASDLGKRIGELSVKKKSLETEHSKVSKQINNILSDVTVTDHAIIRYFERVLGYNIEEIEKIICPDVEKERIKQLVNCEYPLKDFRIIVQSNKVVTVYPNKDF